jgi:alkylation response protein AidB-like acyl-CoA dehydrogenase
MPGALNTPRPVVIPKTRARRDGGEWVLNGRKRHMCDMEALLTYEGTAQIQTLLVGRDITGQGAFA